MAFDLSTAKPLEESGGFDLSTAVPVGEEKKTAPAKSGAVSDKLMNTNIIEGAYQGAANLGRQAGEEFSNIIKKSGIAEPAVQSLTDLYKGLKSTTIGKMLLNPQEETLKSAGRGLATVAEAIPQTAEVLKQGLEIGNLIPIAQGMKAAAPMAGKALLEGEMVAGDVLGRTSNAARNLVGKIVPGGAPQRIIESGAKWSTTLKPDVRKALSETMLNEKINLSPKGYDKLDSTVTSINDEIKNALQPFKDNAIDADNVVKRASAARSKAAGSYDSALEVSKVDGEVQKFLDNWGGKLTVEKAQSIKQDIYKQLKRHYESISKGGPGLYADGEIAAKKNIARGLKEEIEGAVDTADVKALNARESELLRLEPHLRRAVGRIENHNILSIDDVLAASAGAVFGGAPGAAAAGIAKKSLGSPAIKSKIAQALEVLSNPSAPTALKSDALRAADELMRLSKPKTGRPLAPSIDAPMEFPPTTMSNMDFWRPTVDKEAALREFLPNRLALPPGQGFTNPTSASSAAELALQRLSKSQPAAEIPIVGGVPVNENVNLLLNEKIKAALDKPDFLRTAEDQLLIKRGYAPSLPVAGSDPITPAPRPIQTVDSYMGKRAGVSPGEPTPEIRLSKAEIQKTTAEIADLEKSLLDPRLGGSPAMRDAIESAIVKKKARLGITEEKSPAPLSQTTPIEVISPTVEKIKTNHPVYGQRELDVIEEYGGHYITRTNGGQIAVVSKDGSTVFFPALDDSTMNHKWIEKFNTVDASRDYLDWLNKKRPEIGKPAPPSPLPEAGAKPATTTKVVKKAVGPENAQTFLERQGGVNFGPDYNLKMLKQDKDAKSLSRSTGMGPDEAAQLLNDAKIKHPDGGEWTSDRLAEAAKSGQLRKSFTPEKQDAILNRKLERDAHEHWEAEAANFEAENSLDAGTLESSYKEIIANTIAASGEEGFSIPSAVAAEKELHNFFTAKKLLKSTETVDIPGASAKETFGLTSPKRKSDTGVLSKAVEHLKTPDLFGKKRD